MIEKKKPEISFPWLFIVITMVPIWVVAFSFSGQADSYPYIQIEAFIDRHLLGASGFWSSGFPWVSKVIANYVGLAGPLFSIVVFFSVYKNIRIDPAQYEGMTLLKYLFCLVVFSGFIFIILSMIYFDPHDLAVGGSRSRMFGTHVLAYALFSCAILFIVYFIPVIVYFLLVVIPAVLWGRYK